MQDKFDNLHKFIANNYDLENLEAKLNEFNPLKILKVDNYEIRHSNIISWLLNPRENHNLGDAFIKKFLAEIIINNDNLETSFTVFKTQEISFHDFEIKREWKDIDIFLVSHTNKLAIIIENKIHAAESKGQLQKYYNAVSSQFNNYEIIPVFLSLNGTIPSDERYGTISYSQVLHMLKFITSIKRENLSPKVFDFINYYSRTLEILTMKDEEIKKLCKKIYKEHKQALDLIYEYVEETEFEESAQEFIRSLDATEIWIDGRSAWFIPKKLEEKIEKVGEESWCNGYPIAFWYTAQEEKLGIILEVGPFRDSSLRRDFLTHLKDHNFTIHDRSFKPGAKYTRIFTKYPKFEDWDNKESIIQKMDDLYSKSARQAVNNLINACATFNWKTA
jgi:hypothetical protein